MVVPKFATGITSDQYHLVKEIPSYLIYTRVNNKGDMLAKKKALETYGIVNVSHENFENREIWFVDAESMVKFQLKYL